MNDFELDINKCWVTWDIIGFGVTQFTCFCNEVSFPIGVVWTTMMGAGNGKKKRCEISYSYIVPFARRKGVRSLINKCIFEDYGSDVITTQDGSDTGGLRFMKASGYLMDKRTGIWSLTKKDYKAKKRRV